MDRLSRRTSRFYCLFYRWSRLTSTHRPFHTSFGRRESASSTRAIRRPQATATFPPAPVPPSWLTAAPTSATEATRLPNACVGDLENKHARSLTRLRDKSGANNDVNWGRLRSRARHDPAQLVGMLYSPSSWQTKADPWSTSGRGCFLRSQSRPIHHRPYSTAARIAASRGTEEGRPPHGNTSDDSAQLADDLKRTLRTLTHPVVLITSRAGDHAVPPLHSARGVTVSSFNTVSLSPTPIVSFNLRVPSRSWDAIRSSEHMAVHLLTATPEGAAMAHAFTQPYQDPTEPFRRLERLGVQISTESSRGADGGRAPSLTWDGATIAVIEARLLKDKCVEVGDHLVVLATVESVSLSKSAAGGVAADRTEALSYAMRGYRTVGSSIDAVDIPKVAALEPDFSEAVVDEIENCESDSPSATAKNSIRHSSRPSSSFPATAQRGFASSSAFQRRHFTNTSRFHAKNISDCVSDLSLLSTTVDDFLGNPPDSGPLRVPRIAGLIQARKESWHASRQLERALARGTLTPEDSARLEDIVTRNERHIARKLAARAAGDLKRMLDLGRLDFRRAQWMESTIEKGQAVLLEEAKLLRKSADDGKFTADQFQKLKEELQQENQVLTVETMRLRQMVDEEAEGGGAERSFDGFHGNV